MTKFGTNKVILITSLIIYVNDMIITGDDKEEVSALKEQLSCEFEMKDLR